MSTLSSPPPRTSTPIASPGTSAEPFKAATARSALALEPKIASTIALIWHDNLLSRWLPRQRPGTRPDRREHQDPRRHPRAVAPAGHCRKRGTGRAPGMCRPGSPYAAPRWRRRRGMRSSVVVVEVAAPGRIPHHPGITPAGVICGDHDNGSISRGVRVAGPRMPACTLTPTTDAARGIIAPGPVISWPSSSASLTGHSASWLALPKLERGHQEHQSLTRQQARAFGAGQCAARRAR